LGRVWGVAFTLVCAAALLLAPDRPAGAQEQAMDGPDESQRKADPGCISCHGGIEVMHPWDPMSCTDCHGGDGKARDKDKAHVQPGQAIPNDERTVGLKVDPEYRRFVNPTDLRVI
jgi:hypothetical protein